MIEEKRPPSEQRSVSYKGPPSKGHLQFAIQQLPSILFLAMLCLNLVICKNPQVEWVTLVVGLA